MPLPGIEVPIQNVAEEGDSSHADAKFEIKSAGQYQTLENSPGLWPNGVLDNRQLNPYQSLAFLAT